MRLLIWASSYGQTIGGGPILAPLLAADLVRRGHKVTVLTDRRPESLPEEEENDGVRIYRPLFRRALGGEAALIPGIRRQVADLKRDFRPDLVFIFSSGYGEFFHHVTGGGEALPLVVGLHDMFGASEFRPDAIVGKNLRAASRIVACSAAVLENACGHLPALRPLSQVIHNALPAPAECPASGATATIAFAGRLIEKKGADTLIAAFDLLKDRYPRLRLALAGEGEERGSLEADVARRGLAARVSFAGSLAHEQIYPLLAEATLVAVPSKIEPFGLVALEAAQMGRPVVASTVDGLPEIVVHGQTGLLVPPRDAAALAGAIASLLDNPDRAAAMGEAGRRRVEDRFGWERYVSAHEQLFSSLLAEKKAAPRAEPRIDPRTVPRGRLLDRLGTRRPAASMILLTGNERLRASEIEGITGRLARTNFQIILACDAETEAPAGLTVVRRNAGESAIEQINRASALASGRLICATTPEATGLPELIAALTGDPELGAAVRGSGNDWVLAARENLWAALGGLEAAFEGLEAAIADFFHRARAIGMRTQQVLPPSGSAADVQLLRQRAALCPDLGAIARSTGTAPRLSVYTAITESYDTLKPQPADSIGNNELVAFLDDGTAAAYRQRSRGWRIAPLALEQTDPHRAARFPKINAHLALPASGYSLWIDASIGIVCPFPLGRLVELFLQDCDICLFRHYARRSIYEEAEACKAYGLDRTDIIDAQMARYRAEGLPEDSGLAEAPVILRRHTPAIRRLNEAWWTEVTGGSRRDQLSFNYVIWKLGLRYATFPLSLATGNGLFVKFQRPKQ